MIGFSRSALPSTSTALFKWVPLLALGLMCGGCGRVPIITFITSDYERTLDSYGQEDTTLTDVNSSIATDGRRASLLSAFFGLDSELPLLSGRFICEGSGRKDGMPVIFSHEVDPNTIEPGDFKIVTESGTIGEITCLTLAPADDAGELRTALLVGEFGSIDDQPASVLITGNVLSSDKSANFKGSEIMVTPLEADPSLVLAEQVPEDQWSLESEPTDLLFGGGSGCPAETQQIIRITWSGGVTKPGGQPAGANERSLYQLSEVNDDGYHITTSPAALADLQDGDNNHKLCLDTEAKIVSVSFPAGNLTDPRGDLNPDTEVSVLVTSIRS